MDRVGCQPPAVERQRGFTLVELITVIIILGILAAVAAPRFMGRGAFDSRAFSDEVRATLRLAQKLAIAQHRNTCVVVTVAAPATLTINVSSTEAGACDVPLPSLSGDGNYLISAPGTVASPGSVTLITSTTPIIFDRTGSASAVAITLQVNTEAQITVEPETGYVR